MLQRVRVTLAPVRVSRRRFWLLLLWCAASAQGEDLARVRVTSSPDGADVELDGSLVGQTPASFSLTPGPHTFVISKVGFVRWTKTLTALRLSDISLNAELASVESDRSPELSAVPPGGEVVGARRRDVYPALNFGRDQWTSFRLQNRSSTESTVRIEGFFANGAPMVPIEARLGPREERELRLQPLHNGAETCWAVVDHVSDVGIAVAVESLRGNRIEYFNREPVQPQLEHRWANPSSFAQEKMLYYVNTDTVSTVVGFCQGPSPAVSCANVKPRFAVNPRGSLLVPVKRLGKQFAIVESYGARQGIVLYLHPGQVSAREFGAESTVTFGAPVKQ